MKQYVFPFLFLVFVVLLFFWQIFKGFMPFPGDLLIDSNPYRSLSVLGFTPGAYPNKAQDKDVITEMYPWKYFAIQEMKHERIPFWDPHNFSGNILMQNLQSAVFTPFNAFFFIMPFNNAWTLYILIQPVLAAFFFFLFARELKLSTFSSILGAIGFSFSSYMTVWIEYGNIAATFAFLPLLLFLLLRFLKGKKVQYYAAFVIAATIMLFSGYIQGAFYAYVVAFFFLIVTVRSYSIKLNPKLLLTLFGMFFLPVMLSSIQLFPTYDVFRQSTRSAYTLQQFRNLLQPVWYWITLLSSDFFGNPATRNYYLPITYIERVMYIGVPLLIFSIVGIFSKKQFRLFFLFLSLVILISTTNLPGIAYLYRLPIPVIDTTVPTRMLSIFMFCMVTLAAFGIDYYEKEKRFPKKIVLVFAVLYGLIWIIFFLSKKILPQFAAQVSISEHNFILPTFLFLGTVVVFFFIKKSVNFAKILLAVLIIADLFYVFQKITPFSPSKTAYPVTPVMTYLHQNAGINRFWGYGSGYVEPNYQTVDGTYSPEGNDPLHMKWYGELLASSGTGDLSNIPPRPDANIASGYGPTAMQDPFRQRILDITGVKYILQFDSLQKDGIPDTQTFPKEKYSLVWSKSPWQVYENLEVLPRYFLTRSFVVAKGPDAIRAIYNTSDEKKIVLNQKPTLTVQQNATGSVSLVSYQPQYISFKTNTTGNMLLFLSDTYFSSWQATVDGVKTPVYLADYAFRGVLIPKGTHTVIMQYIPQYFSLGLSVSLISFAIFIISIIFLMRYDRKK